MSLNGWHVGERSIHHKFNFDKDPAISTLYSWISGDLDPDHAVFHSTCIPFLPVTTLDKDGRPWGSILAAEDGLPGPNFIRNTRYTTLRIRAKLWEGEPFKENSKLFQKGKEEKMLIAGIGLQFSTRRRNKLAGWVSRLEQQEKDIVEVELTVNQSLGNCPKYITTRSFVPRLDAKPEIRYQMLHMPQGERLPDELISFILQSDTVFFGTTYTAPAEDASLYPSHVGMNQRGGRKGFIRVSPKDGRTVVLPDYSGNRFLTSLGNVEASHLAALTFVSFSTGAILYLTGEAHNHVGTEAKRIMPFHNGALTAVKVTGYTFVEDALPVRVASGSSENPSPYSPPITYLAEEPEMTNTRLYGADSDRTSALLSGIELHSDNIATFTWEASNDIDIEPGQAIILDFSTLLGQKQYQHMANYNPKSVNDDRIRTWTVSNSASWSGSSSRTFALTMREQPGGLVTGALFSIARRLAEAKPELLKNPTVLEIRANIVGVSGGFGIPKHVASTNADAKTFKLLWVAGGIGVTPFLSMLRAPYTQDTKSSEACWDVRMVLSANNPDVLVPLVRQAFEEGQKLYDSAGKSALVRAKVRLLVDVYSSSSRNLDQLSVDDDNDLRIQIHSGRVPSDVFSRSREEYRWDERDVYLCGPKLFESSVLEDLVNAGVEVGRIKREAFAY